MRWSRSLMIVPLVCWSCYSERWQVQMQLRFRALQRYCPSEDSFRLMGDEAEIALTRDNILLII
jgi:hypothetical protein